MVPLEIHVDRNVKELVKQKETQRSQARKCSNPSHPGTALQWSVNFSGANTFFRLSHIILVEIVVKTVVIRMYCI